SFGAAAIATSAWSPGAREAFCSSATEITGDAPAAVTAARASRPLTPGTLAESLLDPLQRGHHVLDAGLRLRLRVERSLRLEVERAHLRELPLTCDPKQDEQAEVDRERPDHLVPPRQAEMDQVVGHALGFAARS